MSRHQVPASGGPKLPKAIADQVGASKSGRTSRAPTRKDLRKQDRQAKKKQNKQNQKQRSIRAKTARNGTTPRISQAQKENPRHTAVRDGSDDEQLPSDDDLIDGSDSEVFGDDDSDDAEEAVLPAPTSQKMSKTSRARLDQEDAEIAALERKLGIKKKGGKAALEDGLDDLLGEIDDAVAGESAGGKRKLQADEDWLKQKRRKLELPAEVEDDEFEGFSDEPLNGSSDIDGSGEESGSMDDEEESEADEEDLDVSQLSESSIPRPIKARENPYRAPITTTAEPSIAKYVPPSLRGTGSGSTQDESVVRLHRKIQGLVNRLSESNMLSILSSMDALYQDNARGHVTEGLINTLLALIADSASLTDTFITLHGGFIAGLYRIVGVDFGAQLLERVAQDLSILAGPGKADTVDKKQINLVSLLATLYTFSVISSTIIYDLLRHYISDLSETSTELLLRIVRTCGPQLRSDDPSALKDVVALISTKVSTMDKSQISVRQSFMVETITDLKNNKLKGGLGASATRAETITRMKKLLGTIKAHNTNRTSEPLRITLSDLQNADKKGKWWLE
ncbi:armadillo-type protein [Elsinoe ampelina]|uniref:Armadillo-type protein n=1 Tax=Elsinoe ampelina TaxID=302913 RepID=A0A6A6FYJ7_9PEZI|nr:armadillo-type protein [Elsinoe ampelina]